MEFKENIKEVLEKIKEETNTLFYEANLIDLMFIYNKTFDNLLKQIK